MIENLDIIQTTELNQQEKKQILDLWNNEYPEKLTYNSITEFDNYLHNLSNITHYLLNNKENLILGWAFKFERDNKKWFAVIIAK